MSEPYDRDRQPGNIPARQLARKPPGITICGATSGKWLCNLEPGHEEAHSWASITPGTNRYDPIPDLAPGHDAARPYAATTVFTVLKALGYGAGQADLAISRAMSRGSWPLSRHVVRYDGESGLYEITPRRTS